MGTIGAVVAAARLRKEREMVAYLREQSAFTPATARSLEPDHRLGRAALRNLVRNSAVIEAGSARYYLDESAYSTMRSKRTSLVALAAILALAVIAILLFVLASGPAL